MQETEIVNLIESSLDGFYGDRSTINPDLVEKIVRNEQLTLEDGTTTNSAIFILEKILNSDQDPIMVDDFLAEFLKIDSVKNQITNLIKSDRPIDQAECAILFFDAISAECPPLLELMVRSGIDVNMKIGGVTPLHKAVKLESEPILELLLDNGADYTVKDESGQSLRDVCSQAFLPDLKNAVKNSLSKENQTKRPALWGAHAMQLDTHPNIDLNRPH